MYDVFISFKKSEIGGMKKTGDYYLAERLYDELKSMDINAFLSEEDLKEEGTGDYKNKIDKALVDAKIFILVATKLEYYKSTWVKSEWDLYDNLRREGKKESDSMFIFAGEDLMRNRPDELSGFQMVDDFDVLITFIKNRTQKVVNNDYENKSSYYTYEGTNEKERLLEQAIIEARYDVDYLKEILIDKDKEYNVLDVGCSSGGITKQIFGKLIDEGYKMKIIGTDHFEKQVKEFNDENIKGNMKAYVLEYEETDWVDKLRKIMDDEKIEGFDLVYCAFSLLHFPLGGKEVLKGLYNLLNCDGYIYYRGEDDDLKVLYPNRDVLREIIEMSTKEYCPDMCDRFHGRKMPNYLAEANFTEIKHKTFIIDTIASDKKIYELLDSNEEDPITKSDLAHFIYQADFAWRIDDFKHYVDISKNTDNYAKAMANYEKMKTNLELIKKYLVDNNHYFGYFISIFIAQKKKKRLHI